MPKCIIQKELLKKFGAAVARTISRAELAQSAARRYGEALCKELCLDPYVALEMGKVKDPERVVEKANGRYDGDVSKVGDVCRLQIYFDTPQQALNVAKLFFQARSSKFHTEQEKRGFLINEVKDNIRNPTETGWIGLNIKLNVDLGKGRWQTFEVQAIPSQMRDVYITTHGYLENIRRLRDNAKALSRRLSQDELNQIQNYKQMAIVEHGQISEEFGYANLSLEAHRAQYFTLNHS